MLSWYMICSMYLYTSHYINVVIYHNRYVNDVRALLKHVHVSVLWSRRFRHYIPTDKLAFCTTIQTLLHKSRLSAVLSGMLNTAPARIRQTANLIKFLRARSISKAANVSILVVQEHVLSATTAGSSHLDQTSHERWYWSFHIMKRCWAPKNNPS